MGTRDTIPLSVHPGTRNPAPFQAGSSWCVAVAGSGLFRMGPEGLARYRRQPAPIPEGWTVPQPSRLRHSDDQTLAALGAVYTALRSLDRPDPGRFRDWGVVGASRFLGRAAAADVLERFVSEGAWGVTPHMAPHHTLHSQSGTLSQVLGIHGPNLGVGGGADAAVQGFVAALTWLTTATVPGVWVVMSGWTPEYVPDGAGHPAGVPECLALALGLVPADPERGGLPRIRLRPTAPGHPSGGVDLEALHGRLRAARGGQAPAGGASHDRATRVRVGSATYRLDPGHAAAGARTDVVARGCGFQIELESAAFSGIRRRLG